jgi:predicted phosphodiesterase
MKLRFLQISDLHYQFNNYSTLVMRDKLIDFLGELKGELGFDFLLLTGDISHRGDNYNQDIKEYLNEITSQMELSKENVHIVPGNHDIQRDDTRSLIIDGIYKSANPSEKVDTLEEKTLVNLLEGQNAFFEFYKDFKGIDYPKDKLHFSYFGKNYNLLLINTCLVSHRQGEEGTLLTARMKLYEAIKQIKKGQNQNQVLNLAIGHHTLECIDPLERESIRANFDDCSIDMYLSGHVHDPKYNVTANQGDKSFLELVSGAIVQDEYAVPGFIDVEVDLNSGQIEVTYYVWNSKFQYWSNNNQVGKRAKDGKLNYKIERLANLTGPEDEINEVEEEIDESEFKRFIIDFHELKESYKSVQSNFDNKIELEKKFNDMLCGKTFRKKFADYSKYFGIINQIMESTSYVSADKKDLIAETIVDKYLEFHNEYDNGDQIFIKIISEIHEESYSLLPYSKALTKQYIKILTCWCIYECEIFNDDKRSVLN